MTNQAAPPIQPPSIYELYSYFMGILNMRDPSAAERVLKDATETMADRSKMQLDTMFEASGMRPGPPAFRAQMYALKTASEPTHGLWHEQAREYPLYFMEDAKDAVKLGAPVPPWVLQAVVQDANPVPSQDAAAAAFVQRQLRRQAVGAM